MKKHKNKLLTAFSLMLISLIFLNSLVVFAEESSSLPDSESSSVSVASETGEDAAFNGTGEENVVEPLPDPIANEPAPPESNAAEPRETFIIVFLDKDENLLSMQHIPRGGAAAAPTPPVYEGFVFIEWDAQFDNIQASLIIRPVYRELGKYAVVINYIKDDGEIVAQPYEAELSTGQSLYQHVISPSVQGYVPDKAYVLIDVPSAKEDVIYTVNYYPSKLTPYTVVHLLPNLDDPLDYTLAKIENLYGVTGSIVKANAQFFTGFTRPKDLPYAEIASDGSTLLCVYYTRNNYTLTFDTGEGGSLIAPIELPYESPISENMVQDPQRAGYTFDGWDKPIPATMPAEDMQFTAQWVQKAEARYTLQCYLEDPNNDTDYSNYIGGLTLVGTVGESPVIEVNETTRPEILKLEFPSYRTFNWDSYYSLNSEKTLEANAGITVKSDGSTTLNVYFKRNLHTFVFILDKGSVPGAAYDNTFRVNHGGKTYASGEYSFQAKFGQNIKSLWPSAPYSTDPNKSNIKLNSYFADCSRIYVGAVLNEVTISMLGNSTPGKPIQLIAYPKDPTENLQRFGGDIYLESLDGKFPSKPSETFTRNVNVKEERDDAGNLIKRTGRAEWSVPARVGFVTTMKWTTINLSNFSLTETPKFDPIYYHRIRSYVDFSNVAETKRVEDVLFEQPLKNIDYIPAPPVGMEGYSFAGWYTDRNFSESAKVDLQKATMPAKNLLLYAKWERGTHTVTFDPDNGEAVFTQKVLSKDFASVPSETFVKKGYTFGGWRIVETDTNFSFNMPIIKDINLKINWVARKDIKYTIYYKNKDTGADLLDPVVSSDGVMGSTITAKSAPIEHFLPDSVSKSCVLAPEGASITFEYTPFVTVDYTVNYQDEDDKEIAPSQTKTTQHVQVVEDFALVEGYSPTIGQQTLLLSANPEQNVLTFHYVKNEDASYAVEYYQQTLANPSQYDLIASETLSAPAGTTVSAKETSYKGFTYNRGASTPKMPVRDDGSTVLKMYYDREQFTVTFRSGANGSLLGTDKYENIPYESLFTDKVVVPQPTPNPGYEFSAWNPEIPEDTATIVKDASYTATFTKNQALWATVSYNANGGSGTMKQSEEVILGANYTILENTYKKDGYEFKEWNTKKDGSGEQYAASQTIVVQADITLYAQWTSTAPSSSSESSSSSSSEASSSSSSGSSSTSASGTSSSSASGTSSSSASGTSSSSASGASSSSTSGTSSTPASGTSSTSASGSSSSSTSGASSSSTSGTSSTSASGTSSTSTSETSSSSAASSTQSGESSSFETGTGSIMADTSSGINSPQENTSNNETAPIVPSGTGNASTTASAIKEQNEIIRTKTLEELKEDFVPIIMAGENEIPLYGFNTTKVWALLNLVLTAGSVLCSIYFAILWNRNREENLQKKKKYIRISAIATGALLLIIFFATQNLNNLMVVVDRWTLWMFLLVAVQIVLIVLGWAKEKPKNKKEEPAEENK